MKMRKVTAMSVVTLLCLSVSSGVYAQGKSGSPVIAPVSAISNVTTVADNRSNNTVKKEKKEEAASTNAAPTEKRGGDSVEQQLSSLMEKMNKLESIIEEQQKKIDELEGQRGSEQAGGSADAANGSRTLMNASVGRAAKPARQDDAPLSFHIGSAEITPVGMIDFTGVFRTTNSGTGAGTSFGSIPFNNTIQGNLTETRLSAQNSRFGFRLDAKVHDADVLGFLEMDFLGNNAANTFVTTNSHTNRMRQYWVDIRKGKLEVLGGQAWSLLTPNRHGLSPLNEDVFYTQNIDQNYQVGLAWARQAQVRFIYHPSNRFALGVSVENPEQFVGAGEVIFPFAFNAQLGVQFDAANNTATPNLHPDIIGKFAFDARRLHIEAGGMVRTFRETTLPIGGTSFAATSKTGGAGMLNLNLELVKNFHLISNNYFSDGGGRYATGLAPDVVIRPNAAGTGVTPSLVHTYSTVQGLEAQVGKALFYGYYGGVYVRRNAFQDTTSPLVVKPFIGFGGPNSPNSANRAIQEGTAGLTYTFWKDPKWGAMQWATQASYLTRSPWFVAAGAPKNAHSTMVFFSMRYILPGKAEGSGN